MLYRFMKPASLRPRVHRYMLPVFLLLSACNDDVRTSGQGNSQPLSGIEQGKVLFQQRCATCHALAQDMTGPKLEGVLARWNNDSARIKAFIHNSSAAIGSGDALALEAARRGNGGTMPAFPDLSDAELNQLLDYFQNGR